MGTSHHFYEVINVSAAGARSDIVLLDLNLEGLRETKAMIVPSAPGVSVHLIQADLGKLDSLESTFMGIAKISESSDDLQQYVLIHNAGTAGDMSKSIAEQQDPKQIQDYLAVNFTSVFLLTSHFLSRFTEGHRLVLNISSALAFQYHPGCSYYSSGKAARSALMGVVAAENPSVRVLNYLPGPCNTEMLRGILGTTGDEELAEKVGERFGKTLLTCRETISELVKILKDDKFENGASVTSPLIPKL